MYIGFDFSLAKTGVAILDEDNSICLLETIVTQADMLMQNRLIKIADAVTNLFKKWAPDAWAYESPATHMAFGVAPLCMVHGAVYYALAKSDIPLGISVAPTTLKKFITGSGRAEKSDIKMKLLARWGVEIKDDNQADAYGLAKLAGCIHGGYPMSKGDEDCLKGFLAVR